MQRQPTEDLIRKSNTHLIANLNFATCENIQAHAHMLPLNLDEPKLNINRGLPLNGFSLLDIAVQYRARVYSAIIPLTGYGEEVG